MPFQNGESFYKIPAMVWFKILVMTKTLAYEHPKTEVQRLTEYTMYTGEKYLPLQTEEMVPKLKIWLQSSKPATERA